MRILKSPIFIICCILFVVHQAAGFFYDQEIPIIDPYLDVFLAMPIILTFLLVERRYLFKWKDYYRLSVLEIIMATAFVAFVSEFVFPALSEDFTGDWLDVALFFVGAVIFYLTINPSRH